MAVGARPPIKERLASAKCGFIINFWPPARRGALVTQMGAEFNCTSSAAPRTYICKDHHRLRARSPNCYYLSHGHRVRLVSQAASKWTTTRKAPLGTGSLLFCPSPSVLLLKFRPLLIRSSARAQKFSKTHAPKNTCEPDPQLTLCHVIMIESFSIHWPETRAVPTESLLFSFTLILHRCFNFTERTITIYNGRCWRIGMRLK